jgi:hypothetical protein
MCKVVQTGDGNVWLDAVQIDDKQRGSENVRTFCRFRRNITEDPDKEPIV